MNRVKTLLEPILANQTYNRAIREQIETDRLEQIAEGTVKISPTEARSIETATEGQVNAELLLQLNKDDLGTSAQKASKPKETRSSKSPSVSMRGNPPPRREW